ncbi:hypothetical protein NXS19_009094 [Fusarium pseudograminearum]|nr:hypothetical protein NXS19_009094 [Fusarium pseudograminearum]
MRTSFVFLPEDGFCFVDKNTGEEYPIDFYDPYEWIRWHLSPCMQPALPPHNRPQSSSFSSFLPNSLRARAESRSEKGPPSPTAVAQDHNPMAPQLNGSGAKVEEQKPSDLERKRYLNYLGRTLAATRKFRSELAHSPAHQETNAYPLMLCSTARVFLQCMLPRSLAAKEFVVPTLTMIFYFDREMALC